MDNVSEFSIEANPGTISESWINAAVESGINRISIGMQSSDDSVLQKLGRIHNFVQVSDSVRLCRKAGIRNLNLDLIFGIPGQTLNGWLNTLEDALSLEPEHISAYGLIPEENTPLYSMLQSGQIRLPEPEDEREMYDAAIQLLGKAGFSQYEISNFALPGFECRHNIGYWEQISYVGLGVSASSMIYPQRSSAGLEYKRVTNTPDLENYEHAMEKGENAFAEISEISPADARFETLMLSLRMTRGVDEDRFLAMHGIPLNDVYGKKLESFERKGLLEHTENRWKLTRRGMDIMNSILVELMD